MTSDEIRRANLIALIVEFGSVDALAEIIEKSGIQIIQWKNASLDSRTKKPRGISDDVCRHIESRCSKERGWMDNIHRDAPANAPVVSPDSLMQLINIYANLDEPERVIALDFAAGLPKRGAADESSAQNNL